MLPEPAFSSVTKGTDVSSYLPLSQDQRHLVKVIQNRESDIQRPDNGMLLGEGKIWEITPLPSSGLLTLGLSHQQVHFLHSTVCPVHPLCVWSRDFYPGGNLMMVGPALVPVSLLLALSPGMTLSTSLTASEGGAY